jgi:hypothetical protein
MGIELWKCVKATVTPQDTRTGIRCQRPSGKKSGGKSGLAVPGLRKV